jgi:FMN phosphatase YigB (HAD superfamily)
MPTPRIVCFDVGGVIARHCRTWREGCLAAGLPVRDGCESGEMTRLRKQHAMLLTCGKIDPPTFYQRMAETTGNLYTPAEIELIHHRWLGREYEGVGDVIRRLVGTGRVETGVLSNTNAPHWARFLPRGDAPPDLPTVSLLSHRYASHELGLAKPMPEIYARFEELTGFRGRDILFLDDLPENLAAASARGWTAAHIDHTRETAPQIEHTLQRHGIL